MFLRESLLHRPGTQGTPTRVTTESVSPVTTPLDDKEELRSDQFDTFLNKHLLLSVSDDIFFYPPKIPQLIVVWYNEFC